MTVNQHAQKQHLAYLELNHNYYTRLDCVIESQLACFPSHCFSHWETEKKKTEFEKDFYDYLSLIILKVFYLEEKVFCLSCRIFRQVCWHFNIYLDVL